MAQGPILHLPELRAWVQALREVREKAEGVAELRCIEPNLWAKVELGRRGHGHLQVRLTQEHMTEQHEFTIEIDQSYLPDAISSLEAILVEYPIKEDRG